MINDNGQQPTHVIVWTSSNRAIAVYIMIDGNLEYKTTEDGGLSWSAATVLINNANVRSFHVDYYGWYRGSHRFDLSLINHLVVIANSEDFVYAYRMDAESLEILDAKRKQFQPPITSVSSVIRSDGGISISVLSASNLVDELPIYIIEPPNRVCPLCNLESPDGKPHQNCADREQMMADRE